MRMTPDMVEAEAKYGRPLADVLLEALNRNDGNITATARELDNMNGKTLWNWLMRLHIEVRKVAEIA